MTIKTKSGNQNLSCELFQKIKWRQYIINDSKQRGLLKNPNKEYYEEYSFRVRFFILSHKSLDQSKSGRSQTQLNTVLCFFVVLQKIS